MKMAVLSDPHVDGTGFNMTKEKLRGADLFVIPGDVADGCHTATKWLVKTAKNLPSTTILYVPGNHCLSSYFTALPEVYKTFNDISKECPNFVLLSSGVESPERVYIDDETTVFIGDTLWTDFCFNGNREEDMERAERYMYEYSMLYTSPTRRINAKDVAEKHVAMRENILSLAAKYKENGYKVVVVTHHAPHRRSRHFAAGNLHSAAYVSDVIPDAGLPSVDLWLHGHVHDPRDYMVGNTRVVHNPLYGRGVATPRAPILVEV